MVFRPPLWDSPATHGLFDPHTSTLFAVDALGALLPEPAAEMEEVSEAAFAEGFHTLARALSPWLHFVDQGRFDHSLARIRELAPRVILSSHGPVVRGRTEELLTALSRVPAMEPFVGPDQGEMLAILGEMRAQKKAA